MVFVSKLGSRLLPMLAKRGLATTALRQEVHPSYAKMKETSKIFQLNNGLPVSIDKLFGCRGEILNPRITEIFNQQDDMNLMNIFTILRST